MAHPDLRDDYDDRPGRRRTSPLVLLALLGGGLALTLVVACAGFLLLGWQSAPVAAPAQVGPVDEIGGPPPPDVGPMPREVKAGR